MGIVYNTSIVRDGLSLFYDPANIKSYPGSGTTIYDLSGNGNHGVLSGSPVFSNNIMIYDGVDDHITVPYNQTSLDFSLQQTVIIWMYHTYTSGRKNPYNQAYGGYGTWTHENGSYINYYYGTAGTNSTPYTNRSSASTPTSTWQMMSSTRSVANMIWYRNDSLSSSLYNPYGTITTTNINITFGNGYAGRWVGNMGPMMLYKRELTLSEIQQNFNAIRGRYGI